MASSEQSYRVYVGAYTTTWGDARGIGLAAVTPASGQLSLCGELTGVSDPSFLALAPDAATVYAVHELPGQPEGRVGAFAVHTDGTLRPLGDQPSGGAAPCHLTVHPSGRYLLTANFESGTTAVHPINPGGDLAPASHVLHHSGAGPHERQDGPHVHMVAPDPAARWVLALDLGTDTLHTYAFDRCSGLLREERTASLPAGSGPRHFAFHPDGDRLFVLGELSSTLTECSWDEHTGQVVPGRTISTLPVRPDVPNYAAEIVITQDGNHALVSNRGLDGVAVFDVRERANPRFCGQYETGGRTPRHIALSPCGELLFVAHYDTDTVCTMWLRSDGSLEPTGEFMRTPAPVCALPGPSTAAGA